MAAKLTKMEPWVLKKHHDDAYSYVMKNGVSKIKNFFEKKLANSAGGQGKDCNRWQFWIRKIYFYQQNTKVRTNGSISIYFYIYFFFTGRFF